MEKKKILVIDDMPNTVTMLKARLEASGYKVFTALTAQEGLTCASKERPDLILLDIIMPAGGGYSIFTRLKRSPKTQSIPVVFLTAKDRPEDVARAYKLGVQHYIKKPYKPEILLETVRKVLESSAVSKQVAGEQTPETPLPTGRILPARHPWIRSLAVSGSGFLGNLSVSWNRHFNVIIGAKGAGKSALLESLRYAFDIDPHSDPSSREESIRHAIGSDGKVEVLLERPLRDGKIRQYRVTRSWGEAPHLFQVNPEKSLKVSPSELLASSGGASFFGKREIEAVSGNDAYWLALLDESIGKEARKCSAALGKSSEALSSNAVAILEARARLAKRDEYCRRLKEIEDEIEAHPSRLPERSKELNDLRAAGDALQNAIHTLNAIVPDSDSWRTNLLTLIEAAHRNLLASERSQTAFVQQGTTILGILEESLKVVLDDQTTLFEQAIQSLKRLEMRHQEKLRSLGEESKRMEQDPQIAPTGQDQRLSLGKEKTSLASRIEELNGTESRLKTLLEERPGLLQQVKNCRTAQTGFRDEKVRAIVDSLQGRLRLEVKPQGQKKGYKQQLSSLLNGSHLSGEAIDLLIAPEGTDGIALAEAVRKGSEEVQSRFGLKPEIADGLTLWLTSEESRLFELETLAPEDALQLKLKTEGQYRSLEDLSAGQAASAILLLLLGLGNRILAIDPPEDYLDDRSVYEEVLQTLREQKELKDEALRRQVIVTTSDATLPVMTDAELTIPLELQEGHPRVIARA